MNRSYVRKVILLLPFFSSNIFVDSVLYSQPLLVPRKAFAVLPEDTHPWGQNPAILRSGPGTYYIVDAWHAAIQMRDSAMVLLREIGGRGSAEGEFLPPMKVALGREDRLYVLDNGNKRIQIFDRGGDLVRVVPIPMPDWGWSIAVDDSENFYVLFPKERALLAKFDSRGRAIAQFGQPVEEDKKRFGRNVGYLLYDRVSDKLFLAFMSAPIVRVFSTRGELEQEIRPQSKIVQEIEASECNSEVGGMTLYNIYSSGLAVINGAIWVMLSRGTATDPALYGCDLKGNKLAELPILYPTGDPVKGISSGCIDGQGNCAFVVETDKILVAQILGSPAGSVR